MVRTIKEITEDNIVIQQMDAQIAADGDGNETLMIRVLRKNFISTEQNKDNNTEVLEHVKEQKKNPSLIYLLRYKTGVTLGVLFGIYLLGNILFRMIEYFVPLSKMIESVFLP